MKIALFPDLGGGTIPKMFQETINGNTRNWRVVLAEEIDKLPITCDEITDELFEEFRENDNMLYIKDKNNEMYFKGNREIYVIAIEEVNTSKPWRVNEYDGAEEIQYFNGVTVIDEETNECEW